MNVCIGAIAKNENLYIREWVEHHKKLGFDKIFLYDNNDPDGERFEDVIGDYIENGFIELVDFRGERTTFAENGNLIRNVQSDMCQDCYIKSSDKFDWIAIIDIDEFIIVDGFDDIKTYLEQPKFDKFNSIRLNWKMYSDGNLTGVENNNYNCLSRFFEWKPSTRGKSINRTKVLNSNNIQSLNGHGSNCLLPCDALGKELSYTETVSFVSDPPCYKDAWVNHYKSKTIEEFIYRRCVVKDLCSKFIYKPSDFFSYSEKTNEKIEYGKKICEKHGIEWE